MIIKEIKTGKYYCDEDMGAIEEELHAADFEIELKSPEAPIIWLCRKHLGELRNELNNIFYDEVKE